MDENTANNQVAISTTVFREADVSVRVQAGPDPVVAGRKVTFVITVKNSGSSLANNVRIDHRLPSGMTLDVGGSDPGASLIANNTVRITIPTIASGIEQKLLVTATVVGTVPAGALTSTTSVTADESDPLLGNNQASTVTNVSVLQATNRVVANGDSSAGDVNAIQTIPVSQILANDLNPVNLTSITQPTNGSVSSIQ